MRKMNNAIEQNTANPCGCNTQKNIFINNGIRLLDELYFNKQKAEHAKCFINDIYER